MADFMNKSAGDKLKALLDLVGLGPLTPFRSQLVTAANNAKRDAEEAESTANGDLAAVNAGLNGRSLLEVADSLRERAGLTTPISTEAELLALSFGNVVATRRDDLGEQLSTLAGAEAECQDTVTARWSEAIADPCFARYGKLKDLLEAANSLLSGWEEDTCPLCGGPTDLESLISRVGVRLGEATAGCEEYASLQTEMASLQAKTKRLREAAATVAANPRLSGTGEAEMLREVVLDLDTYQEELKIAVATVSGCSTLPGMKSRLPMDELEALVADDAKGAEPAEALAQLAQLKDRLARQAESKALAAARRTLANAVLAALDRVEEGIKAEIEAAIAAVGPTAADYYGRLVGSSIYTNVELKYRAERIGGIEFSLKYDARHSVTPPQRVLSESQLNALGISLFLAQLKIGQGPWKTIVLDDVVNSFDASHRVGLARLLGDEFGDWQPILLTHDSVFFEVAERLVPRWSFKQILAWTPQGGPVIGEGNPRELLRQRLSEGKSAAELGGLARSALERALSRPVERLGLSLRFDPFARHSAREYLDALRGGLRAHGSTLKDAAVLGRMDAESYLVNLGAHDRPADPNLTVEDLTHLVRDLDDLDALFTCQDCGKTVWAATRDSGNRHQCLCGKLVA
jgi:hypothetical protein